MTKEIDLDASVSAETESVKRIISRATNGSVSVRISKNTLLYVSVVELLSDNTRNTEAQIKYLSAYEQALGVFRSAALEIRKEIDVLSLEQRCDAQGGSETLKKQIQDAIFFSNRYALFFAGHVGLALLEGQPADITNQFSFGTKHDASKDRDELTDQLAQIATSDLVRICGDKRKRSEQVSDDDLKYTLEAVFTSWIKQFRWSSFKSVAEMYSVDNVRLKFKNYSVGAGEFKQRHSTVVVDDRFMPVTRGEVIGGQEFGQVLWQNFLKLAAYDPTRRKNPYDPAGVIFTYGEPGGGKTFTAHAYIQSFAEVCRQKGIAVWALLHSTTDYASEYQNKTANELAALAGRINAFPGIVIMYVADADNIFQSRKDPRLSAEQQNQLGVYFKMFDGTFIRKNGKFMAVMDANYVEGIDDATKSRLFNEVVEVKRFDKGEDFAELVRRSLTKGAPGVVLSPQDWSEIGDYVLKSPLSNREVGHVIDKLRRGFTVDEGMLGKSFEEHEAYRNEQLRGITKATVIDGFETYITTRMNVERASYEARRKDDRDRFLDFFFKEKPPAAIAVPP